MREGRALGLLVVSTLHSCSFNTSAQQCVMCQLQKLNKPENRALELQRTCFVLFFSQPSITNKTALTFMPHKSHIWLTSNFCFLFIHQKLVLSAEQYTQRVFSFKYLAVYVNAFISDPEITENLSCSFFF